MVHSAGMLRWLYVGRMTLAAGVFAGAVLVWPSAPSLETLIVTLAFLSAISERLRTTDNLLENLVRRMEGGGEREGRAAGD